MLQGSTLNLSNKSYSKQALTDTNLSNQERVVEREQLVEVGDPEMTPLPLQEALKEPIVMDPIQVDQPLLVCNPRNLSISLRARERTTSYIIYPLLTTYRTTTLIRLWRTGSSRSLTRTRVILSRL